MKDAYLNFSNSSFGTRLVSLLGLPKPLPLERFDVSTPLFEQPILVGGALSPLTKILLAELKQMGTQTVVHAQLNENTETQWCLEDKPQVKALIFDASGIINSSQTTGLFEFFNQSIKSLIKCGRIIVIGRPPELCVDPKTATVQRALEGFVRSLAKECKRACTAQLIYVEDGSEDRMQSTLRFLLSGRSAYVSAQVIRINKQLSFATPSINWNKPLLGKKALVTGAAQGIGAAIVDVMARDGADIVCLDIPQAQKALDSICTQYNATPITLDLNQENAAEALLDAAKKDGGWDIIVHNAGVTRDKTIAKMPEHFWQSVVNINLSVQERINELLLESNAIKENGRVICVSSISGIAGNIGQSNYAFSKAGVIGMVQSSADKFAANNISINAVAPGFIETAMTAAMPLIMREAGRRLNSLNQGGQTVDVAETVAWFANPASNGLNANMVRVCGQNILGA